MKRVISRGYLVCIEPVKRFPFRPSRLSLRISGAGGGYKPLFFINKLRNIYNSTCQF